MTLTLERRESVPVRNERNHSCTGQCPNPCPYTSLVDPVALPGTVVRPVTPVR